MQRIINDGNAVNRTGERANQDRTNALIPHDIQSVARKKRNRTIRAAFSGVYHQFGGARTAIDPEFKMSFIPWQLGLP
jgi:hypothetical protein